VTTTRASDALDVRRLENWSPVFDLAILARTFLAVVRGAGAY
jgi:lipopolysaccharide/colanic/teichoic acid biosynthesis glycosyltransferase